MKIYDFGPTVSITGSDNQSLMLSRYSAKLVRDQLNRLLPPEEDEPLPFIFPVAEKELV